MSGVKLIRGYAEPSKNKEKEKDKEDDGKVPSTTSEDGNGLDEVQLRKLKRRSAPPTTRPSHDGSSQTIQSVTGDSDPRELKLQRQLSSLIESDGMSKARTEEEIRRREEQEIQDDYNAQAGETQGREIEHLVLVTHGIGQLLSLRYVDSFVFSPRHRTKLYLAWKVSILSTTSTSYAKRSNLFIQTRRI